MILCVFISLFDYSYYYKGMCRLKDKHQHLKLGSLKKSIIRNMEWEKWRLFPHLTLSNSDLYVHITRPSTSSHSQFSFPTMIPPRSTLMLPTSMGLSRVSSMVSSVESFLVQYCGFQCHFMKGEPEWLQYDHPSEWAGIFACQSFPSCLTFNFNLSITVNYMAQGSTTCLGSYCWHILVKLTKWAYCYYWKMSQIIPAIISI